MKNIFRVLAIIALVAVVGFSFIACEDESGHPSGPVAPTITTSSLPGGTVGTAYRQTLAAIGTTPITWSVENGALPTGLNLAEATGIISGTPTTADTFTFTVKATNAIGSDTKPLTIKTMTLLPTPTNLSVSGTPSDIYFTVSWTLITESDCDYYKISYGTDSNNLNSSVGSGSWATTCTITGLTANTTYYVRITAVASSTSNTYSDSSPSEIISVKTATAITRTPLPTPTNLSVSGSPSDTYFTVSWTPITESDCEWYIILYGTDSNNLNSSVGSGSFATTCTITDLTANTTYYVRITAMAYSTSNTYSDSSPSEIISVKTATAITRIPLPTPTNLSVLGTPSDTSFTVSWTPITESDCDYYLISYGTDSNNLYSNGTGSWATTYTITGLTANTTYYVRITAMASSTSNTYSDSSPSGIISVKTAP